MSIGKKIAIQEMDEKRRFGELSTEEIQEIWSS